MPDVSIALNARDNYTTTLKKIAQETQIGVKDIEALQKSLTKLNNTRTNLKLDLSKAKRELKEAEERFRETGDAADELALKDKQFTLDNLTSQLKAVSASANAAEKNMRTLAGTNSKLSNRGGSGGQTKSILKGLAGAGIGQMLSQSLSGAANTLIGSYFGDEAGSAVSSVLGNALSGAAIGSMLGPAGAAIGAGIGAITGGITAATETYAKRDEAFKAYVQGQVEDVFSRREEDLSSGSSLAAQRETDLISFSTLFGDEGTARSYLEQVKTMANATPFLYSDLTAMSKTLKAYGYAANEMIPAMTSIGDAGAALGMTTMDMNNIATALGRMRSSDKTTLEDLDILQDRGIDAVGALASAKGVSKGTAYSMISDGDIAGTEAVQIIQNYMDKMYQGSMEQQSKTFSGLQSTLEGYNQELQNAMGEGYNEGKKLGMSDQIDWLGGEAGQKMQEVYSQMGTLQSDLENMQQEMYRDIVNGMFSGDIPADMDEQIAAQVQSMHERYQEAMSTIDSGTATDDEKSAARAELGALMGEAQAMAESEYYNSEAVDILTDANISMASNIQAAAGSAFENAGYALGQRLTRGLISGYTPPAISVPTSTYLTGSVSSGGGGRASTYLTGGPSAIGVDRVPRDNMLYLLHEGERVLPAREARAQDRQGSGNVVINMGGNYTVRQESDIDAIAEAVAARVMAQRRTLRPV